MKERENFWWNSLSILRGELDHDESMFFLLQLCAWIKLSTNNKVRAQLSFDTFYNSGNINFESIQRVYSQLSQEFPAFDTNYVGFKRDVSINTLHMLLNYVKSVGAFDFEQILRDAFILSDKRTWDSLNPPELCYLLSDLVEGDSIYNPFPGDYDLAYYLAKRTGKRISTEGAKITPLPHLINILADTNIEPQFSDPLEFPKFRDKEHILKKFDNVVSIPHFGWRRSGLNVDNDIFHRFLFARKKGSMDIAIVEHILAQTRERAVVVLSSHFLFRTVSKEEDFRRFLVKEGKIEGVILLPKNIFPSSSLSTSILILDPLGYHRSILFINASSEHFYQKDNKTRKNILTNLETVLNIYKNKSEEEEISKIVPIEDIQKNHYNLMADQYVLSNKDETVKQSLSKTNAPFLSEIATIIRPQNIPDENNPTFQMFKEVTIQDMPEFGFINKASKIKYIEEKKNLAENYLLKPFDVVLSIHGTIGKVGIVPEKSEGNWIAGQSFQIIRPQAKTSAIAIYMFLKSLVGQTLLGLKIEGASFPRIPRKVWDEFPIIVPPKERRKAMIEIFERGIQLNREFEEVKNELSDISEKYWAVVSGQNGS